MYDLGQNHNNRHFPKQPTAELTKVSESIFISDWQTGQGPGLSKEGIDAVLCLDKKVYNPFHPDRNIENLLVDLPAIRPREINFEYAVLELQNLLQRHNKVLVHCTHGQNRSVAVVAAVIAKAEKRPPLEVLAEVTSKRKAENLVDENLVDYLKSQF